jgi:hypothetical protein
MDRVGGHTRAPAKPCESGVYDGGRACDFPGDPASSCIN